MSLDLHARSVAVLVALLAPAASAQTLHTTLVQSGFSSPVFVTSPPGDVHRLFVLERHGKIKIIEDGVTLTTPFLDIDALILSANREQGLLGLAFHPDYDSNGKFYVDYTDNSGQNVVREYLVSTDPNVADPAAFADILGPLPHPQATHNSGCLQFGPDGYLYYSLGDGGGANDEGTGHAAGGNAQALDTWMGKLLRIDVDAPAPHVPSSNPFASPSDGAFDLIWAYGLRNGWRFSFDRYTGDLYLADVGQNAWEEVSFQPASSVGGENYGWRCMEGTHCTGLSGCTCDAPELKLPIQEFGHVEGDCAIIGGYVYRGSNIAGLWGTYFYADYCSGRVWSFRYQGGNVTDFVERTAELAPTPPLAIDFPTSFGEDANGEIYLCDQTGGEIYRIDGEGLEAVSFCAGDDVDPLVTTDCPCGNFGATGHGCANSFDANGALLEVSGTTNPVNTLVLTCTAVPNNSLCTFLSGNNNIDAGFVFGDGVRCVQVPLLRFGQQYSGQDGNPAHSAASATVTQPPGSTRHYQCQYRNTNDGYCPPGLFNVSNGSIVVW